MTSAPARKPIDPGIVARIAQGLRYIVRSEAPAAWFGPSLPPSPVAPPDVKGRALDYPSGFNLNYRPRALERIGYAELRALADNYDLLRLVIETRKDQVERSGWAIRPRTPPGQRLRAAAAPDPRLSRIADFFACPDREHSWQAWLRALLEDMLVIDAATIYPRLTQGGDLYALELIDGATVKRVIDQAGRTPLPPAPAYQQVLHGLPAVDYSRDELIYAPRNIRPHKIYGFSPVEQVTLTVNVAIRRQLHQLQYYTEGNVPEALIGVPAAWTPEQIRAFQAYWDSLMEGNSAERRHARFVPGEMKFQPIKGAPLADDYDEWLARIVCFAFSVPPTPFVKSFNRATAETLHGAALAEGLLPVLAWIKSVIDQIIARFFKAPDLEFVWDDMGAATPLAEAEADTLYVRFGIKSVDEVREGLGLAPLDHTTPGAPSAPPSTQTKDVSEENRE